MPSPIAVPQDEPLKQECLHFLDCVRTGATPRTDGREGLRVLTVLSRAAEALARRREAKARRGGAREGADREELQGRHNS